MAGTEPCIRAKTFSTREAVALLVLFVTQVVAEFYVVQTYAEPIATNVSMSILYGYTAVYIVLGIGLFITRRESVQRLLERTVVTARGALVSDSGQIEHAD